MRWAGFAALAAALLLIPLNLPMVNDWLFRASTLVMLAVSWNLMASAGMISLGHSAFWGLGSYACLLTAAALGWSFAASFGPALLAGALAGLLLALITGRLRGAFFAIATLALSEGLRIVGLMLPDLTGGAAGSFVPPGTRPTATALYYAAIAGAAAAALVAWALSLTRLRYAMRAMRDNEGAAQMLGINPLLFRALVCTVAGAIAAAAGGLNLWFSGYDSPDIAFALSFAILAQIATIVGGINTLSGPVIGAVVIVALSEATRILLGTRENYSLLVYGVLLVGAVLLVPRGVAGFVRRRA